MNYKKLCLTAIYAMCLVILVACNTTPAIKPIDYGTAGVGPISAAQTRALLNCFIAGDSATKIVELRSEGKSDDEIIKYYASNTDSSWLELIHDLLPIVAKDNPPASSSRIDYGRSVYSKCLHEQFEPKAMQIAAYCYQQNQFLQLAFSFRDIGEPMENAYTKMGAEGKTKVITDGLILHAKEVGKSQENNFRISTYYGCLGHPDQAPEIK
ncbi:MAG TPA: hypothetical protein VFW00_03990 [Rhodocyclaceae bacterium]|nr:hypothetical protein [Rhodocyclaceae bacterium]